MLFDERDVIGRHAGRHRAHDARAHEAVSQSSGNERERERGVYARAQPRGMKGAHEIAMPDETRFSAAAIAGASPGEGDLVGKQRCADRRLIATRDVRNETAPPLRIASALGMSGDTRRALADRMRSEPLPARAS